MKKTNKARKVNAPIIQKILDETSPLVKEQIAIKMQLASNIDDLIKEKNWSKSEFAEKLGKNPSEITKWLSGTQNFTLDILTTIAHTTETDMQGLFHLAEKPAPYRKKLQVRSGVSEPIFKYMSKKQKQLPWGVIKGIDILTTTLNPIEQQINEFIHHIEFEFKADQENQFLIVIVHVAIKDKKNTVVLGSISVQLKYKLKNFESNIRLEKSGKVKIIPSLMEKISNESISTVRGIMFSTFKGTDLHSAVLPIV